MAEVQMNPADLQWDRWRGGLNDGPWSVSLKHIPTGLTVGPREGSGPGQLGAEVRLRREMVALLRGYASK